MVKRIVRIMPIGLSEKDLKVVKSLCWLSESRTRSYVMHGNGIPADFYLVNGDQPGALAQGKVAHARRAVPIVVLTDSDTVDGAHHVLRRPMVPSRLLTALDQIAIAA
jgi:hypothetical protein